MYVSALLFFFRERQSVVLSHRKRGIFALIWLRVHHPLNTAAYCLLYYTVPSKLLYINRLVPFISLNSLCGKSRCGCRSVLVGAFKYNVEIDSSSPLHGLQMGLSLEVPIQGRYFLRQLFLLTDSSMC